MSNPEASASTLSDVVSDNHGRWRRWMRDAVLTAFLLFVIAGVSGLFDLTHRAEADGDGVLAVIETPLTTRAGSDIQLALDLTNETGLPSQVTLRIERSYLALFEDLSFTPKPVAERAVAPEAVELVFEVPEGARTVRISAEGRAADAWTPTATGALTVEPGEQEFTLRTWRLP